MSRVFDDIIDVNEHIKQIDALSRQVNIEAINASLSARSVGDQGRGFAVVARELQRFSQTLDSFKNEQIALNNVVITLTARRMGVEMRGRHLHKVLEFEGVKKYMADLTSSIDHERGVLESEITEHQKKMHHLVRRMQIYCRAGQAVSKNAMVEAAHCGRSGAQLKKVADAMESAITKIAAQLDVISRIAIMGDRG